MEKVHAAIPPKVNQIELGRDAEVVRDPILRTIGDNAMHLGVMLEGKQKELVISENCDTDMDYY